MLPAGTLHSDDDAVVGQDGRIVLTPFGKKDHSTTCIYLLFTAELPTRVGYLFLGKKAGGSHLIRVGSLIVFCRKWSGGRLLEWGRCTF